MRGVGAGAFGMRYLKGNSCAVWAVARLGCVSLGTIHARCGRWRVWDAAPWVGFVRGVSVGALITATFNTPESNARRSCLFLRNKNVILPASKSKPPIST